MRDMMLLENIAKLLRSSAEPVLLDGLLGCQSPDELSAVLAALLTDAERADLVVRLRAGIGSFLVSDAGIPAKDVCRVFGFTHTTLLRASRDRERRGFRSLIKALSASHPEIRELAMASEPPGLGGAESQ